ncbi:MAG TPA: hypothetical protein VM580_31345 [Labilithrix sp.]|nr:hypothetical protein [Labilithrix sp.]
MAPIMLLRAVRQPYGAAATFGVRTQEAVEAGTLPAIGVGGGVALGFAPVPRLYLGPRARISLRMARSDPCQESR